MYCFFRYGFIKRKLFIKVDKKGVIIVSYFVYIIVLRSCMHVCASERLSYSCVFRLYSVLGLICS